MSLPASPHWLLRSLGPAWLPRLGGAVLFRYLCFAVMLALSL